jgi:hypothetical protein
MGDQIPSLGISAIPNNGLGNNEFSFLQSTLMNQHPNPAKDKAFWFVWAFGRAPQEANDMVVERNDSLFSKIYIIGLYGRYGGVRLNIALPSLLIIAPPFTNRRIP